MPEYVGTEVKVPDAMQTIGSVMNMATQAQALKKARATFDADVSQRQSESQKAGTEASLAAQTLQPRVEQQQQLTAQAGIKTQEEQFNLQNKYTQKGRDILTKFVVDPDFKAGNKDAMEAKANDSEKDLVESGMPIQMAKEHVLRLITAINQNPKGVYQKLLNTIQGGVGAAQQASNIQPSGPVMSSGQVSQQVNTNPFAGPNAPVQGTQTQQLPPPTTEVIDPATGQKRLLGPMAPPGSQPRPGAVPNGGGGLPTALSPSDAAELPTRVQQRVAVGMAASKVPEQHFNNQKIIELAPKSFAGTGGEELAKIASSNGIQWVSGDNAGNFQRLGHFMALQAQANAQAMGAGTDAARSVSETATGSKAWTPDAIISTAKVNDALSTGVDLFNRGMEAAVKSHSGNPLAIRDFQNAWSKTFDVKAMQLHNALEAGDKKEIDSIVQSVGGKNSQGAVNLLKKGQALDKLAKDGSL